MSKEPGPLPWPVLKKGDKVEIVSLKKRTNLNGEHGEIVEQDLKTKRYIVLLGNQKQFKVYRENLRQCHEVRGSDREERIIVKAASDVDPTFSDEDGSNSGESDPDSDGSNDSDDDEQESVPMWILKKFADERFKEMTELDQALDEVLRKNRMLEKEANEMNQALHEALQKNKVLEKEASIYQEAMSDLVKVASINQEGMSELLQENKKLKAELARKKKEPSRVAEKSKKFEQQVNHYMIAQQKFEQKSRISSIIRIQSFCRGLMSRHRFHRLVHQ